MVAKCLREETTDVTPANFLEPVEELTIRGRKCKIRRPTARMMNALSHYKFKTILKYKMAKRQGRVQDVGEQYTSKTCFDCGRINGSLGSKETFVCGGCSLVEDRDANAARNIFHKNVCASILRNHFERLLPQS